MKTSPEALRGVLKRRLPGVCLITGTEPLLIAECCDAIRERARADGYVEREVHFLERGFDWNGLLSGAATLSLFASRRILELKFPAAPDAEAGKALTALAAQPPPDTLLLVSGTLDWKGQKSAWLKAFEKAGLLVMTREIGRSELPRWITERKHYGRACGGGTAGRPRRGQPARSATGDRTHCLAQAASPARRRGGRTTRSRQRTLRYL